MKLLGSILLFLALLPIVLLVIGFCGLLGLCLPLVKLIDVCLRDTDYYNDFSEFIFLCFGFVYLILCIPYYTYKGE